MQDALDYAADRGEHVTLMIGVVAEHDSEAADVLLAQLQAYIEDWELAPCEWKHVTRDCLQAPPERHSVHVEIRWMQASNRCSHGSQCPHLRIHWHSDPGVA